MERGLVPDRLWLVESFLNSVDVASGQDELDTVPRFRGWLAVHNRSDAAATANAADLELARELRYALRAEAAAHHGDGAGDTAAIGEPPLGTAAIGEPPLGTAAIGEPRLGTAAAGEPPSRTAAGGEPPSGTAAAGEPPSGTAAIGEPQLGTAAIGEPPLDPAWLDDLVLAVPLRARASAAGIGLGPAEAGVRGVLGEILAAIVLSAHDGSWRRMKICRAGTCQVAYYDRSKNASRCWCSMQLCGNRNKTRAYRGRRSAAVREAQRREAALTSGEH
jgi:CGNR zinc finger